MLAINPGTSMPTVEVRSAECLSLSASRAAPRRSPVEKDTETVAVMTHSVARGCSVCGKPVVILLLLVLHVACQVIRYRRIARTRGSVVSVPGQPRNSGTGILLPFC
jgi:hypothetical protein